MKDKQVLIKASGSVSQMMKPSFSSQKRLDAWLVEPLCSKPTPQPTLMIGEGTTLQTQGREDEKHLMMVVQLEEAL